MVYRTNETLTDMFAMRYEQGLCTVMGEPEDWQADRFKKTHAAMLREICNDCPVLEMCRNIGRLYDDYTFLGGETPSTRRKFRATADYYRLLEQAAKEGWLDPSIALASQEDISDAITLSKRTKPALVTDWTVEEIQMDIEVTEFFEAV